MKEAGWVVEYKERHRVDASWKLFAVWDGNLDTKTVGQRLEDMGMKVTVSNDGKFIEAHDGMDDFRVRRQM